MGNENTLKRCRFYSKHEVLKTLPIHKRFRSSRAENFKAENYKHELKFNLAFEIIFIQHNFLKQERPSSEKYSKIFIIC